MKERGASSFELFLGEGLFTNHHVVNPKEKVSAGGQFGFDFWSVIFPRPNPELGPPGGPILGSTLLLYEETGVTSRHSLWGLR